MTDREETIIDAALEMFLRYGVKRTSMRDIAEAAGISRQTLYKSFSDKDDVLRATIRLFTQRAMARIAAQMPGAAGLDDKLDVVFQALVVAPFELLGASPHGADLVLGMNAASREEIADNDEAFQQALESILSVHADALANASLDPATLAQAVQLAAAAAKTHANDRAQLDALLRTQKRIIASLVQ